MTLPLRTLVSPTGGANKWNVNTAPDPRAGADAAARWGWGPPCPVQAVGHFVGRFPGFFNNQMHLKKKKKKRKRKKGNREIKGKIWIKRDLRDTGPSQNVDSIWIILQTNVENDDIHHEVTGNLNTDLIFNKRILHIWGMLAALQLHGKGVLIFQGCMWKYLWTGWFNLGFASNNIDVEKGLGSR